MRSGRRCAQRARIESELGQSRRQHVGEQHVGAIHETPQRVDRLGQRQVERHGALAAVVHVEVRREGKVALVAGETRQAVAVDLAPRHLDLDHLGAEIGQQRARRGRGDEARQLDDADPREWRGHARAP